MSIEKVRVLVVAYLSETATEDQVKAHALLMNRQLLGESLSMTTAEPKRTSKMRGVSGQNGPVKKSFVHLWRQGTIAPDLKTLREKIRENKKYFATDEDLRLYLTKSPSAYKENSDKTWSLVRPPKPELVQATA